MDLAIQPLAVRNQLVKILASEPFTRSRRIQRFLMFVVEETLAARADQLGEYAVGIAVFDRGPDFEPGLNPVVRNDARRLRVKLLEYYRQMEPRQLDELTIQIAKGGYVPVFLALAIRDGLTSATPDAGSKRRAVLHFEDLSAASERAKVFSLPQYRSTLPYESGLAGPLAHAIRCGLLALPASGCSSLFVSKRLVVRSLCSLAASPPQSLSAIPDLPPASFSALPLWFCPS